MAYQTTELAELEYLRGKIDRANVPTLLREKMDLMLKRLRRMARQGKESNEYEEVARYVDWVLAIPWGRFVKDNLSLENAKAVMDRFHHGREDIKKTLLEYIAVLNLKSTRQASNAVRTPILCFTGDQGTGKTTTAKAIAASMGRPFYRISMGALGSSEALRGKPIARYDAFPGEVIKALASAKVMNPVILLDEFDKVSGEQSKLMDFMAVLLEILDPQQNYAFKDHYIDYPVDLSQVFFITTANSLEPITPALLDRLEVVHFEDYTAEDKLVIGRDYLFSRVLEKTAMSMDEITISDSAWPEIVKRGAIGPGVRSLEKAIERIARKAAMKIVSEGAKHIDLTSENLNEFLAVPKINKFEKSGGKSNAPKQYQNSNQNKHRKQNKRRNRTWNKSNNNNQTPKPPQSASEQQNQLPSSQEKNTSPAQKEHEMPPLPETAKTFPVEDTGGEVQSVTPGQPHPMI